MTSYSPLLVLAYSPVAAVTSLGFPLSDWLNETVSKMRLNQIITALDTIGTQLIQCQIDEVMLMLEDSW